MYTECRAYIKYTSEVITWVLYLILLSLNRLLEFIKEQLISIPSASHPPQPIPQQAPPSSSLIAQSDPGAMLAALL